MKKLFTYSLTALMFCSSTVYAKMAYADRVAAPGMPGAGGCMIENANLNVSFNGVEQDATLVKTKFDAKVAEIQALLKEAKLDKYEMQSMNYSINPQNYGGMSASVQFNGNMGFQVQPADRATALMAELIKKGYQASVNVNAYRNGNMPCPESDKK